MAEHDWLQVELDQANRRALADLLESRGEPPVQLLRMLRSSRNELLIEEEQGRLILDALNSDRRLSALRARLEAFLGER